MTSREAASAMVAHIDREISADAPDLPRLAAIAGEHGTALAVPDGAGVTARDESHALPL